MELPVNKLKRKKNGTVESFWFKTPWYFKIILYYSNKLIKKIIIMIYNNKQNNATYLYRSVHSESL